MMDDWYLQRQGYPDSKYHLNILLGAREKLTIGRKAGGAVDIVCNGKTVSREHCVLKYVENCWTVEDLKSMNGVFLNGSKIPANTPTSIREGNILGVGAIDTSETDYYVFDVQKNIVKAENENGDMVKIVEVPKASATTNPPSDPLEETPKAGPVPSSPKNSLEEISKANPLPEETPKVRENLADNQNANVALPGSLNEMEPGQRNSTNVSLEEPLRQQPVISDRQDIPEKVLPAKNLPVVVEKHSTRSDSPLQGDPQKEFPISNQNGYSKMPLPSSNPRRPSLDDMKLKLDCRVVLEELPKRFTMGTNGTSKIQTKKRLKGKRRLLRFDSDSESESEHDVIENGNGKPEKCAAAVESKGKELKKIVNLEEPSSSLEDYSDEDLLASTSNAPLNYPITKSKFVVEKLSSSTDAKVEQRIFSGDGRAKSNVSTASSMRVYNGEESSGDCEIVNVNITRLKRADHYPDSDDDVIILSSGDEETFSSQPRFKEEPLDTSSDSPVTRDVGKSLFTNEHITSNSSDEDSRFFPELSQAFLNEIAEEEADEEETNLSRKICRKGTDVDKLSTLLKSGRFNPKGKTTLPTEPLNLHHPPKGRFSFATASTSARRETGNQSEPDETDDQQRHKVQSNGTAPRTIKIIPVRPQVARKRKSSSSNASVRDKMCKEQGLESYVCSVSGATKKTDDGPSTSGLPITVPPKKKNPTPKPRVEVPKAPKSSVPNPVKAKVTKKSRGDMFLKDLVGEEKISKEVSKKPTSALSGFCIPKLSKSVAEPLSNGQEASAAGASAQKRKHPDNDEEGLGQTVTDSVESTAVSYAFKKPQKRVARRNSSHDVDDKNDRSASSKNSERRQDRPRDEALPLGRDKKWFPPNAIRNMRREERVSPPPGNREPRGSSSGASNHQHTNHEEVRMSDPNDETIQLPLPDCDKRLRSLSLSAADNFNRGILRYHGWEREPHLKKKVSIVEKNNKIHEIESRAPTPPLPRRTPVRPVDQTALTHDILYRICSWNYDWIAQQRLQQQQKNDEPPPLLNAVHSDNGRNLPSLCLLPVVSAYDSLEAYCSIFQSLMFHELWANLCKDMENSPSAPIKALIYSRPRSCDGFALLQCEALAANRIYEKDLLAITVPISSQKPPAKYFGVVDKLVFRNWCIERIDPRLLESGRRPNEKYLRMSFVLWVKLSNVPKELDKVFTVTKITRVNTALKQFILNAELARSPLCDVILHPSDFSEAFKLDEVDTEGKPDLLNPIQLKAVESITRTIVCASDREPKVALLQGPPGTGKSHVIVELISRMLYMHYEKTNKYPRILVCAPSNNAVDEIASRLMNVRHARKSSYNMVRVGVTASMHPNVSKISLDESTKRLQQKAVDTKESPESCKLRTLTEELNSLRKNKTNLIASIDAANKKGQSDEARMHARKLELLEGQIEGVDRSLRECKKKHYKFFDSDKERVAMKRQIVSSTQVIFSTLNSCRSREMEELFVENGGGKQFLCCIVDEASQCTEPESLTPLIFGISKLILIGDPDQLPATVTSQCAARNRFDQSLFNRFYSSRTSASTDDGEGVMMLDTQYRMAPSICEWPSKYFYGGKLVTAPNLPRTGPCYDYRVLNVIDGLEMIEDQSYKNDREALLVAKIVLLILNSPSAKGKSVGVITFYRSQQQCILNRITEEAKHLQCAREIRRAEVNTVDSFQGREKDIVIVSCVRAREARNLGGDIGFVSSLQRLNVALTRAKESLIVCGHFQTLQINETWRDLINNAQGREVAHVVTSDYTSTNLSPLVMRPEHRA